MTNFKNAPRKILEFYTDYLDAARPYTLPELPAQDDVIGDYSPQTLATPDTPRI